MRKITITLDKPNKIHLLLRAIQKHFDDTKEIIVSNKDNTWNTMNKQLLIQLEEMWNEVNKQMTDDDFV